eukprot:1161949-Pelagomonas_calceolata.AAC.12
MLQQTIEHLDHPGPIMLHQVIDYPGPAMQEQTTDHPGPAILAASSKSRIIMDQQFYNKPMNILGRRGSAALQQASP